MRVYQFRHPGKVRETIPRVVFRQPRFARAAASPAGGAASLQPPALGRCLRRAAAALDGAFSDFG